MRRSVPIALLFLAAPAVAQDRADVVVTGKRLETTAAALEACIARRCPPDEDIRATLAHAENQVVAGDYKAARGTLGKSIGRNKGEAKGYPVPVGDLYRASSRVAVSLGEGDSFRVNTIDSLDALKAGLPDTDPRVLAQRLEVGDMFARVGRTDAAIDTYGQVERQARKLDLYFLNGAARLRAASLRVRTAEDAPKGTGFYADALRALDAIVAETDPRQAGFAYVARVMKAQLMARRGDGAALDAIIAQSKALPRPVLLSSKPIEVDNRPDVAAIRDEVPERESLTRLAVLPFDDQWIDVSFWIKLDGTVEDVDIARQSPRLAGSWTKPVLASVRSRRYAPLKLGGNVDGLLRVERYTFTSFMDNTASGTRLRVRSGIGRIDMLDLTAPPQTES